MRGLLLVLIMVAVAWMRGRRAADAGGFAPADAPADVMRQETVDDNDDTRVEVQLVVLGVALALVVGLGDSVVPAAKAVGAGAPPPEQPSGDGHH